MALAVLKVMRIKNRADLAKLSAHGRRLDACPHVDRQRSNDNVAWTPPELDVADCFDIEAAVDAIIARSGAKVRKNGAVAAAIVLSASGEFFESDDGGWDGTKIDRWFEENRRALCERFEAQVASIRLDLDEATPHIHAIIVPIYLKSTKHKQQLTVSYRKAFGGDSKADASERMKALQDWYAQRMAPLGLQRGVAKAITGVVGLTHQQYRSRQAAIEAENIEAVRRLQRLLEQQQQILQSLRKKQVLLEIAHKNAEEERTKLGQLLCQVTTSDRRLVTKGLADIYGKDDIWAEELEAASYGL